MVVLCVLLSVVGIWATFDGAMAAGESIREAFAEGNADYEAGRYDEAIERFEALVAAGVVNGHLHYNLGNAYYRNGELGRAVLNYERALRLNPRDRDARENLALVRSMLKDKQFVSEPNRVTRSIIYLHNNLSIDEMTVLASFTYVLFCLFLVGFIFRERSIVVAVYRRLSILSPGRLIGLSRGQDLVLALGVLLVLFATSAFSAYRKVAEKKDRSAAVILSREIPVFSSPTDDATLQFRVHEGTMVKVSEQRQDWVRIQLPGGLSGWISSESVERI